MGFEERDYRKNCKGKKINFFEILNNSNMIKIKYVKLRKKFLEIQKDNILKKKNSDLKNKIFGSLYKLINPQITNYIPERILEEECVGILKKFFKTKIKVKF